MLYLWLALDPTADSNPDRWIVFTTLIFIFQLATAFIQTGLFKFHKRDFKTSKGSSDESKNKLKGSVGSTSVNLSAAATRGDSTAMDTITTERIEDYDQNDNSSEESSESKPDKDSDKNITLNVTNPLSPRTDDTNSEENSASQSNGNNEEQPESGTEKD